MGMRNGKSQSEAPGAAARPYSLATLNSAALGCALSLAAWSCAGPGNTGRSAPDPMLVRAVPWTNGVLPIVEVGNELVIPALPVYPPIASGVADPGSQRFECSALEGIDFSPGWLDTFEPDMPDDPAQVGVSPGWSSYDDLTQYAFHVPGDATWYSGLKGIFNAAWGMPSDKIEGPSCDGKPNHWALHFRGGLFRNWGGGVSHALTDPAGCTPGADFCPPAVPPGALTDSAGLPRKSASGDDYKQSHDFVDVSAYEGVAFWARRGPEGQDHALLILTDKFTSSRLARENQTFCRRLRECHTRCLNEAPCSPDNPTAAAPVFRCFDPRAGALPTIAVDSLLDLVYPRCGPSACTSPATYLDPDFDDKTCRPYSFPGADVSGEYCWNEGAPPPPSRDESCQDGWQTSVPLTMDWKFHAIPFSELGQVGFGKRAPYLDLRSIDTIAFGSTMGFADVYIDNVTFYRHKK
ncbi:MAG TPA: hypothetical protein VK550_10280 [Polyangiaceae bacterium]|nr:hypothetical protein [Polyangiaceae bacterium]